MAFTREGLNKLIAGQFPDGMLRGRVGIQVTEIKQSGVTFKFIILDSNSNTILFEYDPIEIGRGQQTVLGAVGEGLEAEIPIEVVQ